jgi:hypothetical protein
MTRTKEPPIGTTELPNYKSPPSRIIRSRNYSHPPPGKHKKGY